MDELDAEISKINFLLENLYVITFKAIGVTSDQVPAIADEACRQCELPATTYGGELSEDVLRERQEFMVTRVAMHFALVRDRLQQEEQRGN